MPRPDPIGPIGQASDQELVSWIDNQIYYQHPQRARDISNYRRAELYDQGYQWLWRAMSGIDSARFPSQWVQMYWGEDDPQRIPMPVFNEGFGARVNESARLGRPNFRPIVRPRGDRPDLKRKEGARKQEHLLRHRLKEMLFDKVQSQINFHMPLYGGVYLQSEWVMRWDKLTLYPSTSAAHCERCKFILTSKRAMLTQVPGQMMGQNALSPAQPPAPVAPGQEPPPPPVAPVPGQPQQAQFNACPQCGGGLSPYQPTMQEAEASKDSLGRPLGQSLPEGEWHVTVPSPYDVFVRNLGYDMRPGEITDWVWTHIEHMEYLDCRWPSIASTIEPETPAKLALWHPVAGAPDVYAGVTDKKVFKEHVRVRERHRHPYIEYSSNPVADKYGEWQPCDDSPSGIYWRLNHGRSVVVVGNKRVFDGPYLLESANYPGEYIPRIVLDYVPWELRDGGRRLQGVSQWELMFDPQDATNQITSQRQAVRSRLAVPIYIIPRTMNMEVQGLMAGVPGMVASIDWDPTLPDDLPKLFNNTTIDHGAVEELEDARNSVHTLGQDKVIESGNPPPGVDAAMALEELKKSAGESREPRIQRIADALKRVFTHGAKCQQAFYIKERACQYEDDNKDERWAYYSGLDLDHDVEVDVEPDMTTDDEKRLAVKDLLQQKIITPQDSPDMPRLLAKCWGDSVPGELFEDRDLQDQSAQREFIDFWETNTNPQVDPTLDDHEAHWQVHGRACHEEKFRDLEIQAHWDEVLRILNAGGGWEEQLEMLVIAPLPGTLQDKILTYWMQMLEGAMYMPPNPEALMRVLQWRAHMEAHKLQGEYRQLKAQFAPLMAAPGGKQTPTGTQPTPGQPAQSDTAKGTAPYPVLPGPQDGGMNGMPGAGSPQEAAQMMGQVGGVMGPAAKMGQ